MKETSLNLNESRHTFLKEKQRGSGLNCCQFPSANDVVVFHSAAAHTGCQIDATSAAAEAAAAAAAAICLSRKIKSIPTTTKTDEKEKEGGSTAFLQRGCEASAVK